MGTGCFYLQPKEIDYYTNNKIIYNPKYIQVQSIKKIIRLQKVIRAYLSKIKVKKIIKRKFEKILEEFEEKKLLNTEVITNSKSEIYYQKLLNTGTLKPFSNYINQNPKLVSKLKVLSKYCIDIPYYIVTSPKVAYKGSWNLRKKYHGYGVIYQFNNVTQKERKIEGIFSEGILNGYGRIIISDEEMLRGDFALNKLNGLGEYHRKDGSIYTGSFYGGYPQGRGRETFKDGSFFEGNYEKGKKKYGKFIWKDKNCYVGQFEKDLFHGQGIYNWGDKKKYDGTWKEGKMNGKGKLIYFDGSYYEGEFVNGLKEGLGKYVWKSNNYYSGEWKNDKQNGSGVYYKNGKKIKGVWQDGKLKYDNNNFNSISQARGRRIFSTEKIRNRIINTDKNNRLTYTNNMEMIAKISGDKKSFDILAKENEEENEIKKDNSKNSIRESFGSVYSIESMLKKSNIDKPQ